MKTLDQFLNESITIRPDKDSGRLYNNGISKNEFLGNCEYGSNRIEACLAIVTPAEARYLKLKVPLKSNEILVRIQTDKMKFVGHGHRPLSKINMQRSMIYFYEDESDSGVLEIKKGGGVKLHRLTVIKEMLQKTTRG